MGNIVTEANCSIVGTAAQGSNRSPPVNNCLPPTKMLRRSARSSDPDGRLSPFKRPFTDACSTASKVTTISHRAQASSYPPSWFSHHTKPAWVQPAHTHMLVLETFHSNHGIRPSLWDGIQSDVASSIQSPVMKRIHARKRNAAPAFAERTESSGVHGR